MRGIITLCGSVRFREEFEKMNRELTLANWIVLAPGVFEHDWLHKPGNNSEVKKSLNRLHCDKIDLSEAIVIINVGGYIGKSTQRELDYAIDHSKIIFWLNPPVYDDNAIGRSWRELVD